MANDNDPDALVILQGLEAQATQGVRIFRTYVCLDDGTDTVFTTTSKEMHLFLGGFDSAEQCSIANLAIRRTDTEENELLMTLRNDPGQSKVSILYTVTRMRGRVNILMSPAH